MHMRNFSIVGMHGTFYVKNKRYINHNYIEFNYL